MVPLLTSLFGVILSQSERCGLADPSAHDTIDSHEEEKNSMSPYRIFALMALVVAMTAALGCNTFKGFGRDVEKGGEKIQQVSESAKPSNNR